MEKISSVKPDLKFNKGITIYFVIVHAIALLSFTSFGFSWSAVAVMLFLHWLTASIGICLGFHRYLTHRGFELPQWLAYFVVLCGALACQNGPIKWAAQHRMHHGGSDTDRDPHNAKNSLWWAHWGWMLHSHPEFDNKEVINNYTKDISSDRFYVFLENYFIYIQTAFGLVLLAIGGLPWVFWGIFLRLVLVYHSTWFVNSAAHAWGYKTFQLENDLSTNCWWVGLIAYGEGWHNNHHAFAKSARHGLRPWEIDMTWMAICVLRMLGLAKNIKVAKLIPNPNQETSPDEDAFTGEMIKIAA